MKAEQENILIPLLNKLFDSLKTSPITSLSDLNNEFKIKSLLLEIEPKIESVGTKIELNEDTNFGIRYANFVGILNSLERYLMKCPEREKFSPKSDVKSSIIVNDLLKNETEQLTAIAEVLLFISSVSSKKDYYLDRLSEMDEVYVSTFFRHLEKYINLDKGTDETNLNQSHLDRSFAIGIQYTRMKEDFEKEKMNLIKLLKQNESEIFILKNKLEVADKNYNELEAKYKDKERDCEMLKNTQSQNRKFQEEMFKDNLVNSELVNQINQKDLEILDLKREIELITKRFTEDAKKAKEKLESYEDKMQEYRSIKAQYDKLNSKYKEKESVRKSETEYEEMRKSIEAKNKQIETLLKEKQTMRDTIEKLNKDILIEREKTRQAEFEKKKLEYDLNEARRDNNPTRYNYFVGNDISVVKNDCSEIRHNNGEMKLFDAVGDSLILEDLKELKKFPSLHQELTELRNEKNDLAKMYKAQIDEIHKLMDDKERLLNIIDNFKLEIDRNTSEKERLGIEKEKMEIQVQKVELEYQKLKINFERLIEEKKKLEEENKEKTDSTPQSARKEIEALKSQLSSNKILIEKMLSEKQALMNDYQNLQSELEKHKREDNTVTTTVSSNPKYKPKNVGKHNSLPNDSEIFAMKNELQNLKLTIIQKDDIIKNLREKVKALEALEINQQDYMKKTEDLEFYKRSYEEQKMRVNKEHELISASLYELALQFMSLKNELQKKINPPK